MHRVMAAGSSGSTSPVRRTAARMRSGMLSGAMKYGSSGVDLRSAGGSAAAAASSAVRSGWNPSDAQVRWHSLSSQSPPDVAQVADGAVHAAFVGEVRLPAGLGEDRVRAVPGPPGTRCRRRCRRSPAVACRPGRRRRRTRCRASRRPPRGCAGRQAHLLRQWPAAGCRTVSPGWISGGNRSFGRPSAARNSVAHSPATASNRPVVEALVASVRRCPVSRKAIRSGISRACSPSGPSRWPAGRSC